MLHFYRVAGEERIRTFLMHERPNLFRRRLSFTPYLPGSEVSTSLCLSVSSYCSFCFSWCVQKVPEVPAAVMLLHSLTLFPVLLKEFCMDVICFHLSSLFAMFTKSCTASATSCVSFRISLTGISKVNTVFVSILQVILFFSLEFS